MLFKSDLGKMKVAVPVWLGGGYFRFWPGGLMKLERSEDVALSPLLYSSRIINLI